MWAKSESLQNAGHQMAEALTPPRRRKPEKNRVLRCQLVLCAAAVLGMLLLQRLRPESAERFKAESRTMLSSPLIGQQQVVRFAMAAAEKLQQAAQIQPQQAQPVQVLAAAGRKTKQPPAGCSLQSPAVQLPLGRPLQQLAVTSGYGWRKAPQRIFTQEQTWLPLRAHRCFRHFPAMCGRRAATPAMATICAFCTQTAWKRCMHICSICLLRRESLCSKQPALAR